MRGCLRFYPSYLHTTYPQLSIALPLPNGTTKTVGGFNSIPNEIILELLEIVLPEDLENFAQTSKRVFLLAKPFLEHHRQLIKTYKKLRSDGSPEQTQYTEKPRGFGPIPFLFKNMVYELRIGRYIRHMVLGSLTTTFP